MLGYLVPYHGVVDLHKKVRRSLRAGMQKILLNYPYLSTYSHTQYSRVVVVLLHENWVASDISYWPNFQD